MVYTFPQEVKDTSPLWGQARKDWSQTQTCILATVILWDKLKVASPHTGVIAEHAKFNDSLSVNIKNK